MPIECASKQVKFAIILIFLFAGGLAAGCMSAAKSPAPDPASVVCPPCPPDRSLALSQEKETLRKELASDREKIELLTRENSDMKLQALANEALINDLKRRSDSQQKRLDALSSMWCGPKPNCAALKVKPKRHRRLPRPSLPSRD